MAIGLLVAVALVEIYYWFIYVPKAIRNRSNSELNTLVDYYKLRKNL